MEADEPTPPRLLATCENLRTCPRVYAEADEHGSIVVQGDHMSTDEIGALPLPIAPHETAVRIPREILLRAAAELLQQEAAAGAAE